MKSDNKRIAYNTLILYIRLIISVVIGLYASRLVLLALGASDFGIYSVIGGIVIMLNILGITMTSTSYRYISVELGKKEKGEPNKIFNTILFIHIVLSLIVLLLGTSLGTWYVNCYMNIDPAKINDGLFVLYVSVLTTMISIISTPFKGVIVAQEKFVFSSVVEILANILKILLILFLLEPYGGNKLRLYAVLIAFINLFNAFAFLVYCFKKNKKIISWNFNRCRADYKGLIFFTWWLLLGAICVIGCTQGATIIINRFFGTIINAAFGIAIQVHSNVMTLVKNITQAATPQIMKNMGAGDEKRSLNIVYCITKYCFFVILLTAIPLLLSIDDILTLWLKKVPLYTREFTILMLINGIVTSLGNGFDAVIQASGKIRFNQIGYSFINILLLPFMCIAYMLNYPVYANVIIMIILSFISLLFQLYVMTRVSLFSIYEYIKKTVIPCIKTCIGVIPLFYIRILFGHDINDVLCLTALSILWILLIIYSIGLDNSERFFLCTNIKKRIIK